MNTVPRRILFLASTWPLGAVFGGQLRALNAARALKEIGEVTVAVVSSDKNNEAEMRMSAEEFKVNAPIYPTLKPNRGAVEKLRWALDPYYLNVHGCVASAADRNRMVSDFARYDLIWVLNSRTPNILQQWEWPHSHLDVDDVPSTYFQAVARNGSSFPRRLKARAQRFLLKRRELLLRKRFTTLSVCSEEDRKYLGGGDQIHVIPNGFRRPENPPSPNPSTNPPRIGFIGLYSYAPNLEGVRWFLKNSWPAIRAAVPGVRFRLIGKDTDGPLKPQDPDVDVLGWVSDPTTEIATWSAMVIPIQFGGGTRVKIADAFSRKCPVVSTRLGAFGYDVQHGNELLLADDNDPKAFATACVSLIQDPPMATGLAERAYKAFLEKWTWDAITPRIWTAAEDCLRRNSHRRC